MKKILRFAKGVLSQFRPFCMRPYKAHGSEGSKVLVCYLTEPVRSKIRYNHSNSREVLDIVEVFASLGFAVDVVDYRSMWPIAYGEYALILGFGVSFSRSFSVDNNAIKILHMTGASLVTSNRAEAFRAYKFKQRNGILLSPRREAYWPSEFATINSDAIFCLGNEWTASTFKYLNNKIHVIPVPYVEALCQEKTPADFANGRSSILWFSGHGALHKGLDLVIESLGRTNGEFQLTICAPFSSETDFIDFYRLSDAQRIDICYLGFVDVRSQKFAALLKAHNFVIMPSCSEGGGSSILTCMAAGLVPIVTEEASIDISNFGIKIESGTVLDVVRAIDFALKLSDGDVIEMSKRAAKYVRDFHSRDSYRQSFKSAVTNVIESYDKY